MPTKLAIGSTVYSCTFFKQINSDESFYIPKSLLGWPSLQTIVPGTFSSPKSQCVSTKWTVFSTQACSGKLIFRSFVKILYTKTHFSIYFCNFHMFYAFQPLEIWWNISVQAWSILFDLPAIWIVSKWIFWLD